MTQYFDTATRGKFQNEWLNARHTFSFGQFHDPDRTGFRDLVVINEDKIAPGGGFATHGHRDMEIITYVLEGALGHKDSLGNGSVIRPGEIQRMSAGTGIRHSELNPSDDQAVHLLQIWVQPDRNGHTPSYEQITLPTNVGQNGFTPIATPNGTENAISLNQDMVLSVAKPKAGETVELNLAADRHGFIQIVKGEIEFDGKTLKAGDAVGFSGVDALSGFKATTKSEILFFDLA